MPALQFAPPETLLGWATLITIFGGMLSAGAGFIIRAVRRALANATAPLQLQLTTMNGEMVRLSNIEALVLEHQQVLANGIGERTKRLEEGQARFSLELGGLSSSVAEIRGYLMVPDAWDGIIDRRTNGEA